MRCQRLIVEAVLLLFENLLRWISSHRAHVVHMLPVLDQTRQPAAHIVGRQAAAEVSRPGRRRSRRCRGRSRPACSVHSRGESRSGDRALPGSPEVGCCDGTMSIEILRNRRLLFPTSSIGAVAPHVSVVKIFIIPNLTTLSRCVQTLFTIRDFEHVTIVLQI